MKVFKIKIRKICFFALSLIVTLALGSCSQNPQTQESDKENDDEVTYQISRDKSEAFLTFVSEISLEDIRISQLAQTRSVSADVKKLGNKIEAGHTMALKHIKVFSEKKGMPVATKTTDQNQYHALTSLNGSDFDAEFCGYMLKEHENVIDKFQETASDQSIDADIRIWAESMIPVFISNHEAAQACLVNISET